VALYDPRIVHASSADGYWLGQSTVAGTVITSQPDPTQVGCGLVTLQFARTTPSPTREDLAVITFHIAKRSSSDRLPLTLGDMPGIETMLDAWWTSVKAIASNQWTLAAYVWHLRVASAPKDGPAVRTTARAVAGAVSLSRLPDQDASTTTIVTPSRRHWGRVYLGGIAFSQLDTTYGRWSNSSCDTLAAAGNALATSLDGGSFALGVWSKIGQGFLDVSGIHVDNVVDIIRRRRAKQRSYIKVYGA
jgi:hypothetical protein